MSSSSPSLAILLFLLPSLGLTETSYGAPAAPVYSPQPASYSAPAPGQVPDYDYYKHEHHHYYHAGPPKVVHVKVPVTQKPYVVEIPQNVPVRFVPVNVPTAPPPPVQVVQVQPQQAGYAQPQHIHHYPVDNECHGYDLDCLGKIGRDFLGGPTSSVVAGGYQGVYQAGYQNPGYVTRKELVKSGLLLGAGILKGALLTTVINNINNNNNGK